MAFFPFIFIAYDKNHELTKRILMHEKVHIKQQKKYFFIGFLLLYFLSKRKRYEFEFEAYIESIKYGMPIEWAAYYLSSKTYGKMKTFSQAKREIQGYFNDRV